jgi:arsenate reductase (glutaredoxin)
MLLFNCKSCRLVVSILSLTFYWYPKCGTCRNAKSGLERKKFFNTSGQKYRELGIKDKLKTATEDEMLELLASDGMLIKRPIVTDNKNVTVGFKEEDFANKWL